MLADVFVGREVKIRPINSGKIFHGQYFKSGANQKTAGLVRNRRIRELAEISTDS